MTPDAAPDVAAEQTAHPTDEPERARPEGRATPGTTAIAWRIRPATRSDVRAIWGLIQESASFHREIDHVDATPEALGAALFSPHPRVHCHVVEVDGRGGAEVVGMAIWYVTFSTWRGRHGLWLEELFVRPEHRRTGAGRALLTKLAGICVERGYARMEWSVMDWNESAQRFYEGLGAVPHSDMTTWRVTDRSLKELSLITV